MLHRELMCKGCNGRIESQRAATIWITFFKDTSVIYCLSFHLSRGIYQLYRTSFIPESHLIHNPFRDLCSSNCSRYLYISVSWELATFPLQHYSRSARYYIAYRSWGCLILTQSHSLRYASSIYAFCVYFCPISQSCFIVFCCTSQFRDIWFWRTSQLGIRGFVACRSLGYFSFDAHRTRCDMQQQTTKEI